MVSLVLFVNNTALATVWKINGREAEKNGKATSEGMTLKGGGEGMELV